MPAPRLRALVLAAGRGERLRPLTAEIPKPLLPVAGRPLIAWTLERLRRAGVESAALNLHHLGEAIRGTFGASFRGMPLVYSEEPELLGTGGAIPPLLDFLTGAERVVIVNGDSLCRWPFEQMVRLHAKERPAATLLVHRGADARSFGGGVALEESEITAFRRGALAHASARRHRVFAGAQIVESRHLARIPAGPGDLIATLYEPLLAEGAPLRALETIRLWHDLGTPRRYLEGVLDWTFRGSTSASRVAAGAAVERTARLRRTLVERGAKVAAGARLSASLVLVDARIGEAARLRQVIVGPGAEVASGRRAERLLFTRNPDGTTAETTIER